MFLSFAQLIHGLERQVGPLKLVCQVARGAIKECPLSCAFSRVVLFALRTGTAHTRGSCMLKIDQEYVKFCHLAEAQKGDVIRSHVQV